MRGIDIPDEVKRRLLRSANDRDSDSRGSGEWREEGAVVKKSRGAKKVNKKFPKSSNEETNGKHEC